MRLILFKKEGIFERRLLREKCVRQYWFHDFTRDSMKEFFSREIHFTRDHVKEFSSRETGSIDFTGVITPREMNGYHH